MNRLPAELLLEIAQKTNLKTIVKLSRVNKKFNLYIKSLVDTYLQKTQFIVHKHSTPLDQTYLDTNKYYSKFTKNASGRKVYELGNYKILFEYWYRDDAKVFVLMLVGKDGYFEVAFKEVEFLVYNEISQKIDDGFKELYKTRRFDSLHEMVQSSKKFNPYHRYFTKILNHIPLEPPSKKQIYLSQCNGYTLKLTEQYPGNVKSTEYRSICVDNASYLDQLLIWATTGANIYVMTRNFSAENLQLIKQNIKFNNMTNIHFMGDNTPHEHYDFVVTDDTKLALTCLELPSQPHINYIELELPKDSGYVSCYGGLMHLLKYNSFGYIIEKTSLQLHNIYSGYGYLAPIDLFEEVALKSKSISLPDLVTKYGYYTDNIVLRCYKILLSHKTAAEAKNFYKTAIQQYDYNPAFWANKKI